MVTLVWLIRTAIYYYFYFRVYLSIELKYLALYLEHNALSGSMGAEVSNRQRSIADKMRQLSDKISVRSALDTKHTQKDMAIEDKGMGVAKISNAKLSSISKRKETEPQATPEAEKEEFF